MTHMNMICCHASVLVTFEQSGFTLREAKCLDADLFYSDAFFIYTVCVKVLENVVA